MEVDSGTDRETSEFQGESKEGEEVTIQGQVEHQGGSAAETGNSNLRHVHDVKESVDDATDSAEADIERAQKKAASKECRSIVRRERLGIGNETHRDDQSAVEREVRIFQAAHVVQPPHAASGQKDHQQPGIEWPLNGKPGNAHLSIHL